MNIFSIAIKELKSNKKTTLIMIMSIIVVTILINSIVTLALSYQDYIVNLSRNKENWEIFFDNIEYENVKYIVSDKNVKQVSIVQDIGLSDNSYSKSFTELIRIKAYDNNALENLNINLKKGRLPQTADEIIINEDMGFEIGDSINITIKGKEYKYSIVGELEDTDFDEFNYIERRAINGAITLCNKTSITDQTYVSVSVISNNISDIYNIGARIEHEINTKNQNINISARYNEELLSYACVAREGSEFQSSIIIAVGLLIGIITISSIALIYTIFNISMSEKQKYIASLSSVGATEKQIFKIYLIEGLIITCIAIPLGLLISFGIDKLLISVLDNLFKTIQGNILNTTLEPTKEITLKMIYSWKAVISSIILVTAIVFLSIFAPIKNASKTTIIDMIRQTKFNKVSKFSKKTPKLINKMFKVSGVLAYKNMKRSRYKFVTMIISLTVSIVLFISVTGYVENLETYNQLENMDYNYTLNCHGNDESSYYSQEILETLEKFDLIDSVYGTINLNTLNMYVDKTKVNSSLIEASKKLDFLLDFVGDYNKNVRFLCHVITFDEPYYSEYLKKVGIDKELNDNECILVNYSNKQTKYYEGLYLTNYLAGEELTLNTNDIEDMEAATQMAAELGVDVASNIEVNLKIQTVTNEIPKGAIQGTYGEGLTLVINPQTFRKLFYETIGIDATINYTYYIYTSNPEGLDQMISSLSNQYDGLTRISSRNYATTQKSNANEKLIKEILLYSFLILICVLGVINVVNIVLSNIRLRRTEFAELQAIGMSEKQINKMLILEGVFYVTIALLIGFVIGIPILYVLYTKMVNTELYAFTISLPILISTILVVYCVIFVSIWCGKRKVSNENISDIIKEKT